MVKIDSRILPAQWPTWPISSCASVLCILLTQFVFSLQVHAQQIRESAVSSLPNNLAGEFSNASFIDVATTARVTQRFEIYDPHSAEELQAVKQMGFTQVILDFPSLYSEAAAMGLNVVTANWWTHETPQADIERAFEVASQLPRDRLAGISMMDEPDRNSPETPAEYYVDVYNRLRSRLDGQLPSVRLEISHWGPLASWSQLDYYLVAPLYKSADVMRIMPYPDLNEGPLNDVYFMMQRSKSLMKLANRDLPLLVILQAWTLPPKSELPTIPELRVMAYQAIFGGAETLSFYHYRPEEWSQTPGFHEGFAELMLELTQVSRRFRDASVESTMTQAGVLKSIVKLPSNETVQFRINTNREAAEGLAPLAVEEVTIQSPPHFSTRDGSTAQTHRLRFRQRWRRPVGNRRGNR